MPVTLPKPIRARNRLLLALALTLPLIPLGWRLYGPRGVAVEIVAKSWEFEIEVEKRMLESASDWCDALPADAQDVSRRAMADPTGRRPGLPEHCRYSLPQWRKIWIAQAEGQDPTPPRWPVPALKSLPRDQIGAERPGKRTARHLLRLRADDGEIWHCQLPLAQWQKFKAGEQLRVQVNRHGVADCATLPVR